jgi:hypothetical protein
VPERLVVGGHTHQQLRREGYANAGSVGMPLRGPPRAFWLVVEDGEPEHRVTAYDVDAAAAELRGTRYPDVEDLLGESLLDPVDPGYVTDLFERASGRDRGGA